MIRIYIYIIYIYIYTYRYIYIGFELNIESVPRNSKSRQGAPTMVGCNLGKFWKFDSTRCSKTAFPMHFSKHYYEFG